MRHFLPMMLTVLPMPKSFGDSHSFTSSSVYSITQEGKAAGGGGTNTEVHVYCTHMHAHTHIHVHTHTYDEHTHVHTQKFIHMYVCMNRRTRAHITDLTRYRVPVLGQSLSTDEDRERVPTVIGFMDLTHLHGVVHQVVVDNLDREGRWQTG